jgi:hypothetical protein
MVTRFLATCAAISFGFGLARAAEEKKPSPKVDVATVARLVGQLGSDRFDDRETAFKELDVLGSNALDVLRAALTSRDEETRRRALDLVQRIEKRLESALLAQPKLVRLVYTDTPVTQAVQDIGRKTGFNVQIEGDQTKLAGRKITLDTGEIPFWQAVDQFCLKAGLVERGSTAIAENANPEMYEMRMERMRMRMWMIERQGGAMGPRPELPLVFLDGQPKALPTYYGGALRVRVLPRAPANAPQSGAPVHRPDGETLLTVELTPEPKMGWQNVLSVRIEKIIDEQGAEMKLPLPYIRDSYDCDDDDEMLGMRAYSGRMAQGQTNLGKQIPIRVRGAQEMKKIKEIHGAVAAEVLTPMQPLLTIDDILNAAGKAEFASGGGSLKIIEAKRDPKGQVTLKVVVEKHVPGGVEAMTARMRMWGRVNQPNVDNNKDTVGRMLVLKDDKGVAIPLANVSSKPADDFGITMEYDLTFAATDKLVPAKLVYVGQRLTTIDVPFVLRDVPVP